MVGVLADELHMSGPFGFLDVLYGDVLFAVDVDREEVHVAPEDVVDVFELFVEDDVAAFEQGVHRVSDDVDGPVALREVGDVDEVDGFLLLPVGEDYVVAKVEKVTAADADIDPALLVAVQASLNQQITDGMVEELLTSYANTVGVKIDTPLIEETFQVYMKQDTVD